MQKTIAIVAGELSGDHLGAGLICALKKMDPTITFIGIGGENMKAAGLHSFFDMERLSVMGIIDPLCRLPELLKMRRFIIRYFTQNPPDCYIGIDAPDFNLGIAQILKSRGIKTLHYVSPTIWAWRPGRIKKIVKALDHILLIFPFEADIYGRYQNHQNQLGTDYVGHPLADEIDFCLDKGAARLKLNLDPTKKIVAILPGSRNSEIRYIAESFIKTAEILSKKNDQIIFVAAMVDDKKAKAFQAFLTSMGSPVKIIMGINQTRDILQACDVAMVVSGTATLETALMKRPFIVGYKMIYWQYRLARWLIKSKYISMPNIIADTLLVTEYIQNDLDPVLMAAELEDLLIESNLKTQSMIQAFEKIHKLLRKNANKTAAQAVMSLLNA